MSDVVKELSEVHQLVEVIGLGKTLTNFQASPDLTNEQADLQYQMHKAMAERLVAQRIQAIGKLRYERAAAKLEELCVTLGVNIVVLPGTTQVMFQNDTFCYTKRVNRAAKSVDLDAFKIALNRLGVDPSIITKAEAMSEVSKKPQTFHEISIID